MKNLITVFFTIFVFTAGLFAQNVTGVVTDGGGLPLPGVNVTVSGKPDTTITDIDGRFSVMAVAGDLLQFSSIGFANSSVPATVDEMKIVLIEEISQLDEVVVVGYGTKTAGAVTGAIAQVKSADIVRTPAQSAIQSIQGKAAGVNITTNDEPGTNPTIRIRGLGTLINGRDPLYVIDGVEATGLNGLSPNEIATMDILKDAASLAIYGQKGANGVVIISTKKGKLGKPKLTYDTYYGQKFIQREVKMNDAFRYIYFNNTAMGSSTYFNQNQSNDTDWLDEITDTGEVMSHYISVAGGSENVNYYFGVTNYQEKGILMGTEFDRTNINSRNDYSLFDKAIKITQNFNVSLTKTNPKPVSAFTNAYKQSPLVPVRFENGRWGVPLRNQTTGLIDINGGDRFNNVGNPVAQLYNTNQRNKSVLLFGSVGLEANLHKNLKLNSTLGANYETYKGYSLTSNSANYLTTNPTKSISDYEDTFGDKEVIYNTLNQSKGSNYSWNWDNYLTYSQSFGKHDITVVAGMSRTTKDDNDFISGTRFNVPEQSNYWSLNQSSYNTETAPGSVTNATETTIRVSLAYFARAEYSFDGKYLLEAIVRREGISAFQQDKRWDTFPSVSAGWVATNEDFLRESKILDYLKIRAGYGEVGNGNASNATNNLVFRPGFNYAFSSDQNIFPGTNIPYQVDPNLTWERMTEIDLGLDFRVLNNRLSGSIDVYDRKSKDVILPIIPPLVISEERVTVNAGEVSNKGAELSLRWEERLSDRLRYWVGGNISYNKNELTKVNNPYFSDYIGGDLGNGKFTKQVLVGEPLGTFYVYETQGYNSDGQFIYSEERVASGSYLPTYTYGLSVGFEYRKFDFSVDAYGAGGNKIYNGKRAQRQGGENVEYDYLDDFWTPSTPNAANPRPDNIQPEPSNYFIEDGDYLRINNITLGYTFPEFTERISKLRIYVTAVNPFLFTKYSGFSPELSGANGGDPLGNAGIELDAYPTNKTFSVGLNMSF